MDILEFIESGKGRRQALYKGYKYCLKRTNKNGTKNWRCVNSNNNKECSGSITTDTEDKSVMYEGKHNCSKTPNAAYTDVEKCKFNCKKRAREELTSIPKIFEEEFHQPKNSGFQFVTEMPDYTSMKSTLYRQRNKALGVPVLPKTQSELLIPENLTQFEDGHNFVLFDTLNDERIICFGSQLGKESLQRAEIVFADGTFKSCNKLFHQLYSLHVDLGSTDRETRVRPALYALLPNRKKSTYTKLFSLIKENIPGFYPKIFKMDFEIAAISAYRECFPNSKLNGCNFHFNQCLWRKVQELGLVKQYKENLEVRTHIKLTASLAHLPTTLTDEGWLHIMENSPNNEQIDSYNDYFVTQWLENETIQDMWICYNQRHRTTNVCESWNSRLNRNIGKSHPNIIELITTLKSDATHYDILQQRIEHNLCSKRRAGKYILLDRRIEETMKQLEQTNRIDIALQQIAHIIPL